MHPVATPYGRQRSFNRAGVDYGVIVGKGPSPKCRAEMARHNAAPRNTHYCLLILGKMAARALTFEDIALSGL